MLPSPPAGTDTCVLLDIILVYQKTTFYFAGMTGFRGSGEDPPEEAADHAYAHGDLDEAAADEAHDRAPP